jgi:hypothetical protein|tara:strand:- start:157 stop:630 length:474 start_codon:yes stop_codon:yes gene_type:complete
MGMTRQERVVIHKKQEAVQIKSGVPIVTDLSEGVSTLRSTDEGIVDYVRYRDILYKNVLDKSSGVAATSFTDSGFVSLANGFLLQWGQVTASSATESVTFPTPFPTACLNVTCTDYDSGDTGGLSDSTAIKTLPTRYVVVFSCYTTADTFFWQAIGY